MGEKEDGWEKDKGEVLNAIKAFGPHGTDPPYVRMAFPMAALPRVLRQFVENARKAMGVEPEAIATPAIAVCAAAIGNTCRIRLNATWTEPAVIWAVVLMESGSLKTPAYNAAVEPLRVAQRLQEEQFALAQDAFKQAKTQFDKDAGIWKVDLTAEGAASAPTEPTEPKPVDYYTSDSTVEALAVLFSANPRGLGLTRDELSGFFGSFGAYKGGRGGDEAAYLEFYNAGSVKLNRASGKRIYVHNAALSIFGTCQPSVFAKAIGSAGGTGQIENGLAARFLIASPEPKPKRWREPVPFESRHYNLLVAQLLSIPLPVDAEGRVEPAVVKVAPAALASFADFVNEHGVQTSAITNAALRYHYAKLEAVAARLALIFYLCDAAGNDLGSALGVQERHVLAGIAIARWYGREALRVYDGYESPAEREKQELLEEIRDHGGTITLREMSRMRRRWGDPLAAEMALRALARSGLGEMYVDPPGPRGGRPSVRFRLTDCQAADQTQETPDLLQEVPTGDL